MCSFLHKYYGSNINLIKPNLLAKVEQLQLLTIHASIKYILRYNLQRLKDIKEKVNKFQTYLLTTVVSEERVHANTEMGSNGSVVLHSRNCTAPLSMIY